MTKTFVGYAADMPMGAKDRLLKVLNFNFPGSFFIEIDPSPIFSNDKIYWDMPEMVDPVMDLAIYYFIKGYNFPKVGHEAI